MNLKSIGLIIILFFGFAIQPNEAYQEPEHDFPIVVCASGVGGVICEFRFEDPADIEILQQLCEVGLLPVAICDLFDADAAAVQVVQVPATCPVLVNFSRETAGVLCDGLERNELCYGYEFVSVSPDGLLTNSGDITELTPVRTIEVGAYNLGTAYYGLNVVHADADLHTALDNGLRMILFGAVNVRNRVLASDAIQLPENAVTVTVSDESSVFDVPASFGEQTNIGVVPVGEMLQADMFTEDGEWLRVLFPYETDFGEITSAWISADVVTFNAEDDADLLPLVGSNDFTPMDSFLFAPGQGTSPECLSDADGLLFLQAPEGVETTYVANDATITITGSVIMRLVEGNTRMELSVLSGVALLEDNIILPAGYLSRINVIPSQGYYIVTPNAEWDDPREMTPVEVTNRTYLENLPLSLLNQPVQVPECGSDSTDEACELEYDYDYDEQLVSRLCVNSILPEEFSVCR